MVSNLKLKNIRFSDTLFNVGDVIFEHQKVLDKYGAVWFGKLGTPIGKTQITQINKQSQNKIPVYLYLVKGNRKKIVAYRGVIIRVTRDFPVGDEDKIPSYYYLKGIIEKITFWSKLSQISPIDSTELSKLKVTGSVLTIWETLYRSSSGHFYVREI